MSKNEAEQQKKKQCIPLDETNSQKSKRTITAPRPWDLPRFCTLNDYAVPEGPTIIIFNQRQLIVGLLHQLLHLATPNDALDRLDLEMINP